MKKEKDRRDRGHERVFIDNHLYDSMSKMKKGGEDITRYRSAITGRFVKRFVNRLYPKSTIKQVMHVFKKRK